MLDYKQKLKERYKYNQSVVRKDINTDKMKLKINNFSEKSSFSVEDIKNEILNNDMFASFFIKDPKKQNIYENEALKYLKKFFSSIEKLPASKKNAKYIVNGKIISQLKTKPAGGHKSIDFEIKNKKLLITHKYIESKIGGGAQDNQFEDVRNFLENIKENKEYNFMAICDGEYFTEQRLSTLNEFKDNNIFITNIEEAKDIIKKL